MASTAVNVVRYSALLTGVFYGIVHRRTLQGQENLKKEKHNEERRHELLKKAQQAWKDKQLASKSDDGVITNPEDPKFDLEKLIAKWEKESA
ncbi:ATP synthase E chain-domain-containing protein [Hysterangium stoloniferum]|nr:ATP synthase E chain-domain-containing protein [Hysterangium stoloniferum]